MYCSPRIPRIPRKCVVLVPKNKVEWSRHSIVEVEFPTRNIIDSRFEFKFKRVRCDKKRANEFSIANTILQQFLHPILLCDIKFKGNCDIITLEQRPYRLPKRVNRSSFTKVRKVHYKVKGWLYDTFGGESAIDACAGALHDLPNWTVARLTSILAIEKDDAQYQEGLTNITRHDNNSNNLVIPKIFSMHGDLSAPLDLHHTSMLSKPVDSIFCNFALHYFWSCEKATTTFLENLLPHLIEGGRVVVTFLDGDKLQSKGPFKIVSDDDLLEFEVKMISEKNVSVYVASIGVPHIESIITRNELQKRFANANLELVSWLPFDTLRQMCPEELSEGEIEMSSMYVAAVFEKRRTECTSSLDSKRHGMSTKVLFSNILPYTMEREIICYLSVPDLLKCRPLSNIWRREIDTVQITSSVKQAYFSGVANPKVYNDQEVGFFKYKKSRFEIFDLTLRSVELFMRMGGRILPENTDDSSDSLWEDNDRRDFDRSCMYDSG